MKFIEVAPGKWVMPNKVAAIAGYESRNVLIHLDGTHMAFEACAAGTKNCEDVRDKVVVDVKNKIEAELNGQV